MGRVTRRGRMIVSNASHNTTKRMKTPAMAIKSFIHAPAAHYTISGVGREKKFLQVGEAVGKGNGFLRPVEKRREAFGHFRLQADGARDDFRELGGMRRGQDDSLRRMRILFRETLPAEYADGGVWIEHVAVALLDVVHGAQGFLVAETAAPDVAANGLHVVGVEIDDAREVAGVSDVHGVGNRVARGARSHGAGAEEFGHHVVGVGRRDELRYAEANALGEQPTSQVAEIAAGD